MTSHHIANASFAIVHFRGLKIADAARLRCSRALVAIVNLLPSFSYQGPCRAWVRLWFSFEFAPGKAVLVTTWLRDLSCRKRTGEVGRDRTNPETRRRTHSRPQKTLAPPSAQRLTAGRFQGSRRFKGKL